MRSVTREPGGDLPESFVENRKRALARDVQPIVAIGAIIRKGGAEDQGAMLRAQFSERHAVVPVYGELVGVVPGRVVELERQFPTLHEADP